MAPQEEEWAKTSQQVLDSARNGEPPPPTTDRKNDKRFDSLSDYEQYVKRYGVAGHPSLFFKPGEKWEDSLFTIIGPGYRNRYGRPTWKFVAVRCECGKELAVSQQSLTRIPPLYSCGCVMRRRWNEIDYSGQTFKSSRSKREITILFREPSGGWVYVCSCCAETGIVPPGLGMTFLAKIKRTAAQRCPNRQQDTQDTDINSV